MTWKRIPSHGQNLLKHRVWQQQKKYQLRLVYFELLATMPEAISNSRERIL